MLKKTYTVTVLLSILLSKSLYFESFGQNNLLIITTIFITIYLTIISIVLKKNIYYSKPIILTLLVIIGSILINPGLILSTLLVYITMLSLSIIITSFVPFSNYAYIFFKIIIFLIVISFSRYVLLFLNIPSPFNNFRAINDLEFQNFVFLGIPSTGNIFEKFRNNGLWWEPGAFQAFINIAFLFGLILRKISFKIYSIFLLGIISTFSTSGFIVFFILSIVYFRSIINLKTTLLIIVALLITLPILIEINYFFETFSKFDSTSDKNVSFQSRKADFLIDLAVIRDHPLLGFGLGNLETREKYVKIYEGRNSGASGTGSNGLSYLFASMGIFSLLIIIPLLIPKYLLNLKRLDRLLVIIALIIIFSVENFMFSLIFAILLIYGLSDRNKYLQIE